MAGQSESDFSSSLSSFFFFRPLGRSDLDEPRSKSARFLSLFRPLGRSDLDELCSNSVRFLLGPWAVPGWVPPFSFFPARLPLLLLQQAIKSGLPFFQFFVVGLFFLRGCILQS